MALVGFFVGLPAVSCFVGALVGFVVGLPVVGFCVAGCENETEMESMTCAGSFAPTGIMESLAGFGWN